MAPPMPPTPAATAQPTEADDGVPVLTHGTTSSMSRTLAASATKVTRITLASRDARPAAKSEPPYPRAEASARGWLARRSRRRPGNGRSTMPPAGGAGGLRGRPPGRHGHGPTLSVISPDQPDD